MARLGTEPLGELLPYDRGMSDRAAGVSFKDCPYPMYNVNAVDRWSQGWFKKDRQLAHKLLVKGGVLQCPQNNS